MRNPHFVLALALFGLASCASVHTPKPDTADLARRHVFMVTGDGLYRDPAQEWHWSARDEVFPVSAALDRIAAGIQAWRTSEHAVALAKAQLPQRVVVFVHGGMNPYTTSRNRLVGTNELAWTDAAGSVITNRVSALMTALVASNCYPLFVVWNSGPFSAYGEHLVSIRQGEKHPYIGAATAPAVLASDLARGLVRLPTTLSGRLYSDWQTTELPNGTRVKRWEGFEELIAGNWPTYHPPHKEGRVRDTGERVMRCTEYVVTSPTKIATLPILDGLGTEAWNIMLRRTRTMFEPPASYEIGQRLKAGQWDTEHPTPANSLQVSNWLNRVETNAAAAMFYLGQRLVDWSADSFADVPFEFYGHSMGTIVLNQLFHNHQPIVATRIGYLAAACSIEEFEASLFPYLRANPRTQFYGVSLHRIRERGEYPLASFSAAIPFGRDLIVRGSLLNWIDDIFAKPNTITDRTLGAWENLTRALPDVPEDLRAQVHFRACDVEPMPVGVQPVRIEPQVHGDFSDTVFWSPRFLWPDPAVREKLLLR